jgi:hypothetical protein
VACMFEAFADELPATFQSELGSRGSKTTATPDVVA